MTKPDLSRQSIIPSGSTASFDGSISIGEKLFVQDVEFVVSGITSGQTLVYNSTLNKLIPTSIDLNASSSLSGMTDVNFTALASGDTLVFNSATNKWENNNITLDTDSVINTSTVTGSTTTNALDNLNTNKADIIDLYKLTNEFIPVTTSITLEPSKMYVVYPLTEDIVLTLPTPDLGDTNHTIVIHKVDSLHVVTVGGYGVTTYLKDADDSVIYMSIGDGWIPFSWRNNASANAYSDSLITQTITNGVTDKSPSEDAVFDAIENAKGFVKDAVNKIAGQTLEVGKINLVNIGFDTIFTLPTASISYKGKVLIVKLDNNPNCNLTINGAAHGSVVLTKFKDSVIFSCVDTNETGNYFWFDISKSVDLITQTITNGVTDKSPSEDAVSDALALKADLVAGKVPSSQLPSYVDDVIEGYYYTSIFYEDSGHTITITGETSKIYIDLPTNLTYRWSGSVYIEISSTTLLGTTDRITVSGNTVDIASTYTGQTSINTVGGITTGSWSGTPINDTYISSASTWNGKQNQLNGNGFVRATGTTIDYLSGTTNQFVKADGSLDSTSYAINYTLTNYVKVDLQNGVDASALINRVDKPFLTLQAAYDAVIASGGTNAYYFDIVGDATFTSNMLTMSSTRGLFKFVFSGKVTSSIVNSGATKGLISYTGFTINNNQYIFNSDFIQTTNVGIGIGSGSNQQFIFNGNVTLKNPKGVQDNYGIYALGNYNSFYAKNLTWDITNDSGVTPYIDVFQMGTYPNIHIETLQVIGTSTAAYTPTLTYGANISNLIIENQVWSCAYTTITGISLTENGTTIDNCELRDVSIASNAGLKATTFNLLRANSINTLNIGNASLLAGFFDIYCTTIKSFNIGNYLTTGIISGDELPFIDGVITINSITRTLATTRPILTLRGGTKLIGGIITVNNTLNSTYAPIKLYLTSSTSTRYVEMVNVTVKNTGIPATSSEGSPFVRGYGTVANPVNLLLQGCTFIGTLGNTNTGTTVFKTEADSATSPLNVEGNYVTNYMGTLGIGVTLNAEYILINNLQP